LIQLVAQGTLGSDRLAHAVAPLAESAGLFLGNFGRVLLLVGATVSSFGYLASDILNTPRTLFAFGRDGVPPKALAHVHPRFRSPDVAIVLYAAIALSLSLISTFEGLAVMANVAALLLYLLCSAAAWQLVRRDVRTDGQPFRFPGARILPFVAIAIIGWMLAQATLKELTVLGIVLAVGSTLYWARVLIPPPKVARG
jgi:amino acid transporter